jgi:hypothetical protein
VYTRAPATGPLPWANQSGLHHPILYIFQIQFNIIRYLRLRLLNDLVSWGFQYTCFFFEEFYIPCLSHFPRFYHPNTIWWSVQVMELLNMQSSAVTSSQLGPSSLFPYTELYKRNK